LFDKNKYLSKLTLKAKKKNKIKKKTKKEEASVCIAYIASVNANLAKKRRSKN